MIILPLLALLCVSSALSGISAVTFARKNFALSNIIAHSSLLSIFFAQLIMKYFHTNSIVLILAAVSIVVSVFALYVHAFLLKVICLSDGDASTLTMSLFFVLGILLISIFFPFSNYGESMFFGNIELIGKSDLYLLGFVATLSTMLFFLCRRWYVFQSVDKAFASSIGINSSVIDMLITIHAGMVISISCYILGIMIVGSLFVGGPLLSSDHAVNIVNFYYRTLLICILISIYSYLTTLSVYAIFDVSLPVGGMLAIITWVTATLSKKPNDK